MPSPDALKKQLDSFISEDPVSEKPYQYHVANPSITQALCLQTQEQFDEAADAFCLFLDALTHPRTQCQTLTMMNSRIGDKWAIMIAHMLTPPTLAFDRLRVFIKDAKENPVELIPHEAMRALQYFKSHLQCKKSSLLKSKKPEFKNRLDLINNLLELNQTAIKTPSAEPINLFYQKIFSTNLSFSANISIEFLDLTGCCITDNSALFFADLMTVNETLKDMVLKSNQLTGAATGYLIEAWKKNQKLSTLKLQLNQHDEQTLKQFHEQFGDSANEKKLGIFTPRPTSGKGETAAAGAPSPRHRAWTAPQSPLSPGFFKKKDPDVNKPKSSLSKTPPTQKRSAFSNLLRRRTKSEGDKKPSTVPCTPF